MVLHIEITRIFLGDGKNSKEKIKTFDIVEILRSNVEVSYVATWPPVVLKKSTILRKHPTCFPFSLKNLGLSPFLNPHFKMGSTVSVVN